MHDYDILDLLVRIVAKAGHCKPKDLRELGRCPSLCKLRDTLFYLARERTRLSYPEIGRCFKRHHSTIMGSVNNERRRLERNLPTAAGGGLVDWHAELLRQLDEAVAQELAGKQPPPPPPAPAVPLPVLPTQTPEPDEDA